MFHIESETPVSAYFQPSLGPSSVQGKLEKGQTIQASHVVTPRGQAVKEDFIIKRP